MRFTFLNSLFIFIGIAIGIILALQIRATPIPVDSFPDQQIEIQKDLLATFSAEQSKLETDLAEVEKKLQEAEVTIAYRSSTAAKQTLAHLKDLTASSAVSGEGIRITLKDNPAASRVDFAAGSADFVQASDLRDLVNTLFLQDARAIAINSRRITPLTSIRPVFDTILVGNFQIASPFIIEAAGNPQSLSSVLQYIRKNKIQMFVDWPTMLELSPLESKRAIEFMSLHSS